MKVERIQIENIPPFDQKKDIRFFDGLNLVIDKNETGKSTIARAILESLFNLERSQKSLKYRGNGRVVIELRINNDQYIIENNFERKRVTKNGEILHLKTKTPGEYLLKLGLDEFIKTAYVGQHELIGLKDQSSLITHLERIVDSSSKITANDAINRLDQALRKFSHPLLIKEGQVKTAIDRIDDDIKNKKREEHKLREEMGNVKDIIVRYEDFKRKRDERERYRKSLLNQKKFLELKKQKEIEERLIKIDNEINRLKEFEDFPIQRFEIIRETIVRLKEKMKENRLMGKDLSELEENELNRLSNEMKRYPELESLEPERIKEIINELKEVEELFREYDKISEELDKCKNNYKWNLERHMEIHRIIENISPAERRALVEFKEKKENLNNRILELSGQLEKKRLSIKKIGFISLGTFISISILLWGLTEVFNPGFIFLILTLIVLAFIIYYIYRVKTGRLYSEVKEMEKEVDELRLGKNLIEREYEKFRDTYKLTYEEYMDFLPAQSELNSIIKLEERLAGINKSISEKRERILFFNYNINPATIQELIRRCEDGYNLRKRILELNKEISTLKERIEKKSMEIDEDFNKLEKFSFDTRIPLGGKDESHLDEFLGHCLIAETAKRNLEELKKERLNLEKEKYPDDHVRKLEEDLKEVQGSISIPEKCSLHEIDLEVENIEREIKDMNDKINSIKMEYYKFSEYRKKLETLENELSEKDALKKKLERYYESLKKAIECIKEISSEHHRKWSDILNERVSEILGKITSKDYRIRFNPDLSFRFISEKGKEMEKNMEYILSGGTIEQIYLSIRMAICDYISDVNLPLILDEPFAHSDDERFFNGMRFLITEFSKTRQIIVLSCHTERHKLLKEVYPEIKMMNISSH